MSEQWVELSSDYVATLEAERDRYKAERDQCRKACYDELPTLARHNAALERIASGKYVGWALVPGGPGNEVLKRMPRRMMRRIANEALSGGGAETA